jgi:protein tyrosine/serine phosphatase
MFATRPPATTVMVVLTLLAHALLAAGCNLTQVVDRNSAGQPILIRSPQPGARELDSLHAQHQLTTVLNLRGMNPDSTWFQEEARATENLQLRWVHLPVSGRDAVRPEDLETFFDLVESPESWPILMHCQAGMHRTGALTAIYRIQYQGWDNRRAVREMDALGFGWSRVDRSDLRRFVLEYEPDPNRRIEGTRTEGLRD